MLLPAYKGRPDEAVCECGQAKKAPKAVFSSAIGCVRHLLDGRSRQIVFSLTQLGAVIPARGVTGEEHVDPVGFEVVPVLTLLGPGAVIVVTTIGLFTVVPLVDVPVVVVVVVELEELPGFVVVVEPVVVVPLEAEVPTGSTTTVPV